MSRHVKHPKELLSPATSPIGRLNDWATKNLTLALGSALGMWVAFIVPLVALKVPKLLEFVGLFSSYWIQLWALFVLQRSQNMAERNAAAKADADHSALSHIADQLDTSTPGGLSDVLHAVKEKGHGRHDHQTADRA